MNWNAVNGATKYKVSWKVSGNDPWTTTTVTATSKVLTGLLPNTKYLWKVKTICSQGISSPFSPNQNFTTLAGKLGTTTIASGVSVYPNPVADQFRVSVSPGMQYPLTCMIYDKYGSEVKQLEITDYQQPVIVSHLSAGNYFMRLMDSAGNVYSLIIVKQ
jgi:hypothetical protein